MMKKIVIALSLSLGAALCACDKDDDNGPSNGDSTMLPIPASVVDGVRLTSMEVGDQSLVNVNYNSNGAISSATVNGVRYDFEYSNTKSAESTGVALSRIVVNSEDGKVTGYNFSFNKDGYVAKWSESMEEKEGAYYFKYNATFVTDYNAEGQIKTLSFTGKSEWNDPDEGHDSESGSGVVKYTYQAGRLLSSSYDIPDEGHSVFTLGYDSTALTNTYNVVLYPMNDVMSHGAVSQIANLFAYLGYLGAPSISLPTSYSYRVDDYYDTELKLGYNTNSAGRVTSMTLQSDGYSPITLNIGYNK